MIPNPLFIKSTGRFVINFLNHSTFGFRDHTRKFGWRIPSAESTKNRLRWKHQLQCNAFIGSTFLREDRPILTDEIIRSTPANNGDLRAKLVIDSFNQNFFNTGGGMQKHKTR
ncbi:Uncharacterised protein [Vibrio cholerae]|uniref:Uncharacterized protein n=1 Tax=Vibrio cholerae TaxID=666 RepID=A0A655X9M6_VIBCL|nr:Uncharacterised protein [Vibrio cholerae]